MHMYIKYYILYYKILYMLYRSYVNFSRGSLNRDKDIYNFYHLFFLKLEKLLKE